MAERVLCHAGSLELDNPPASMNNQHPHSHSRPESECRAFASSSCHRISHELCTWSLFFEVGNVLAYKVESGGFLFLGNRRRRSKGIMFLGCPFVLACRADFCYRDNLLTAEGILTKLGTSTYILKCKDEPILVFWVKRLKVNGHVTF